MNDITGVIAFDPGKATGWARIQDGVFASGQGPLWDVMFWFDAILEFGRRPTVFCEDFIITTATAKKSRQTEPLDGIGTIKFLAGKYGLELTMQPPAKAKSFATDDKLKRLDWYTPTKGGHANDAARHLMVGLVGQKLINPRQLLPEE
jgi:hypothetical protein